MIWFLDEKRLKRFAIDADIDANADMPLAELRFLIPDRPTYRTLFRWANDGVKTKSGSHVTLKTVKLTTGLGSSLAKYWQFLEELQS